MRSNTCSNGVSRVMLAADAPHRLGRWRDYLFGERIYLLLSLTAKSALAWQVFAGTLAD